jgi:hypothetical protein
MEQVVSFELDDDGIGVCCSYSVNVMYSIRA